MAKKLTATKNKTILRELKELLIFHHDDDELTEVILEKIKEILDKALSGEFNKIALDKKMIKTGQSKPLKGIFIPRPNDKKSANYVIRSKKDSQQADSFAKRGPY